MTSRNIMQELSLTVQEEFPSAFEEIRSTTDGVFDQVIKSSESVERSKIYAGWEVTHSFRLGTSGQFVSNNIDRSIWLTNTQNPRFVDTTGYSTFPSAANTPHTSRFKITAKINHHLGNFSLPIEPLKVEALSASTYQTVGDEIAGVAKKLAHIEAVSFYMGADGCLGTFATEAANLQDPTDTTYGTNPYTTNGTDYMSIVITPGASRIGWFVEGMLVDVYNSSPYPSTATVTNGVSDQANPVKVCDTLVVDVVDRMAGTVRLTLPGGWSSIYKTSTDGDTTGSSSTSVQLDQCFSANTTYYLFCADSVQYRIGYYGMDNWIKSSGYLFDIPYGFGATYTSIRSMNAQQTGATSQTTLSLTDYPMFKSIVQSAGGQPLTDSLLTSILGRMADTYEDWYPDIAITTRGVMHRFAELPNTGNYIQTVDRTNRAASFSSGIESWPTYMYEGRSIKILMSRFCRSGCLYALPVSGNLVRYIPPLMSGQSALRDPKTGLNLQPEIEFVNPMLTGTDSIWSPSRASTGALMLQVEAPFMHWGQMMPKDVRGIKLTDLAEADFTD